MVGTVEYENFFMEAEIVPHCFLKNVGFQKPAILAIIQQSFLNEFFNTYELGTTTLPAPS